VRTLLAFHVAPSEQVAMEILLGNFAILQKLDDGYFGQGIYLTLDAHYAIEEYGRKVYQLLRVPLVVCVVVLGNFLPIVESPFADDGFMGQAVVGKADAHIVRVAKDISTHGVDDPLPCMPERWAKLESFTEVVARSESQVLPLGYMMVDTN